MVVGTFTKEDAFDAKFPKGIQNYVRTLFEKDETLTEIKVLFRVKNIGGNGQIALTPHDIAKEEKIVDELPAPPELEPAENIKERDK